MGGIGSLIVEIGANISGFTEAAGSVFEGLDGIAAKGASAGEAFQNTFDKAIAETGFHLADLTEGFGQARSAMDPFISAADQVGAAIAAATPPAFAFSEAAQDIVDKQAGLQAALQQSIDVFHEVSAAHEQGAATEADVARATEEMQSAFKNVTPAMDESESSASALGHSFMEIAGILGAGLGIAEAITSLKELAADSLEAYGKIEMAKVALTELTGSAETAEDVLSKMKDLAMTSIFQFPDLVAASQKMAALGVAAEHIPAAMQAVAAAAEVTGNGLDSVSSALDRIYLSATIQPRTLSQLGISMGDLAETMGVSADKVASTFKAMGSQSDDALQILTATINRRMADAKDAMSGTLPVTINSVKATWDSLLEDFGKEIKPSFEQLLMGLKEALPLIEKVASGLASIAVIKFDEIVGALKAIGVAAKETLGPVADLAGMLDFKSIGANIVESIVPLNGVKAVFLDIAAAVDVWKGKYPDLRTALQAVNDELSGLTAKKEADAKATLSKQIADDAELVSAVQAAARARELAEAQENATKVKELHAKATAELNSAESLLSAAYKSTYVPTLLDASTATAKLSDAQELVDTSAGDLLAKHATLADLLSQKATPNSVALQAAMAGVKEAEVNAKDAAENLRVAQEELRLAQETGKSAAEAIQQAEASHASFLKETATPVVLDYQTALANVTAAKAAAAQADSAVTAAEKALVDYMASTGTKTLADEAALVKALSDARLTLKTNLDAVKISETLLAESMKASQASQKESAEDALALDRVYDQKLTPHTTDLLVAMQNVTDAAQKDRDAAIALQQAKAALDQITQTVGHSVDDERVATQRAADARAALKIATSELSTAERDLQQGFGVSKDAITNLASATDDASLSSARLESALGTLKVSSLEHYQAIADKAKSAMEIIDASMASPNQKLLAHIQYLKDLQAEYEAEGTAMPAAQQIALAKMEQQEKDYVSNSITRWSNLYNSIHSDFSGMFSGLINDFFSGGDFMKTITDSLKKVGDSILSSLLKPFTDQATAMLSNLLTSLTSKLGDWLGNALGSLTGNGGVLGTGVGAATSDAGTAASTAGAATTAASAGTEAAGAGGSAASTAGTVLTGFMGWANVVTGAISAVTGILSLFGVGQGGQKDRLNIIANNTSDMDWAIHGGEGSIWATMHDLDATLNNLFQAFTTWYKDQMGWISDRITDVNTDLRGFATATFPVYASESLKALGEISNAAFADLARAVSAAGVVIPTSPTASPASGSSAPAASSPIIKIFLDGRELSNSWAQYLQESGVTP